MGRGLSDLERLGSAVALWQDDAVDSLELLEGGAERLERSVCSSGALSDLGSRVAAEQDRLLRPVTAPPNAFEQRRSLWGRYAGVGSLVGATAALAVAVLVWPEAPSGQSSEPLRYTVGSSRGVVGHAVQASADAPSASTLRFSDGSRVRLHRQARVRVESLDARGATVSLERGRASIHVQPRRKTRWTLRAGPFTVHVVGTRFGLSWEPQAQTLMLAMKRGKVWVEGPVLGRRRTLIAGQSLRVWVKRSRLELRDEPDHAASETIASRAAKPAEAYAGDAAQPPPAKPAEAYASDVVEQPPDVAEQAHAGEFAELQRVAERPAASGANRTSQGSRQSERRRWAARRHRRREASRRSTRSAPRLSSPAIVADVESLQVRDPVAAQQPVRVPSLDQVPSTSNPAVGGAQPDALSRRNPDRPATRKKPEQRQHQQKAERRPRQEEPTQERRQQQAEQRHRQREVERRQREAERQRVRDRRALQAVYAALEARQLHEAFRAAQRAGWNRVLVAGAPSQVLSLADAARFARRKDLARKTYLEVRRRSRGSTAAAQAAFALGQLAFVERDFGKAARWFDRYLAEHPRGKLALVALGRRLEALARAGRVERSCAVARSYLERAPDGPHRALARRVLRACSTDEHAADE
jgi:tetratricopeptide (TPR) repeat protein